MSFGNRSSFPAFPEFPLRRERHTPTQRALEDLFLDSIQGNILKGHGRENQRLVFFRFPSSRHAAFAMLRAAVQTDPAGERPWAMSALNQLGQRNFYQKVWRRRELVIREKIHLTPEQELKLQSDEKIVASRLFSSLMLTHSGLIFLGIEPPRSSSFELGIKTRMTDALVPGEMEAEPYASDFHGVFLLACDDPMGVEDGVHKLTGWCRDHHAEIMPQVEAGMAWREKTSPYGNDYRPPREPFGFADGISQPHFFEDERRCQPLQPGKPTAWAWTDLQAESIFITSGAHAGGSFAVLLKIEQRVATFRRYEERLIARLTTELGLAPDIAKYVAPAILMGRTRHGYALHDIIDRLPPDEAGIRLLFPKRPHKPDPTNPSEPPPSLPPWLNEFDFTDETHPGNLPPKVGGCPFHMHMRKMNPRATTKEGVPLTQAGAIRAQPIRRGATYDPKRLLEKKESGLLPDWPDEEVGLLFLAYMGDLNAQFDQLHTRWTADTGFPVKKPPSGRDPILGRPDTPPANSCELKFGEMALEKMPENLLRRLGGVYLYVPSIFWLRNAGH